MKKLTLLLTLMLSVTWAFAQTEARIDFNNYAENQNLNGQDNWVARAHSRESAPSLKL